MIAARREEPAGERIRKVGPEPEGVEARYGGVIREDLVGVSS